MGTSQTDPAVKTRTGSVPGWGTKILHASRCSQKVLKKTLFLIFVKVK